MAKDIFLHLFVILFTGGVCLNACWNTNPPLDQTPPTPGPGRPPRSDTPLDQTPPRDQAEPPRDQAEPPRDQADPPPGSDTPQGSRLQHTVYERPVRILLECILVHYKISKMFSLERVNPFTTDGLRLRP